MNPLLLNLLREAVRSEVVSRAAPYAPSGIQGLLPQTSLRQDLTSAVDPLLYLTGLKQEAPPTNLPTDYMVSPTGVMDTAGNQMVTGQGIMAFQPVDQHGLYKGFDPMAADYLWDDFETGASQGPGDFVDPFQQTKVDPNEYQAWFNPVPMPDLAENLPGVPQPEAEQTEEDEGGPFGILNVAPQLQNVFAKQNALQQR
jgi:hypothetical protein